MFFIPKDPGCLFSTNLYWPEPDLFWKKYVLGPDIVSPVIFGICNPSLSATLKINPESPIV